MSKRDGHRSPLEQAVGNWRLDEAGAVEPEWLKHQRQRAREYFRQHGIPTPDVESFRFLPLGSVVSETLGPAISVSQDVALDTTIMPVAATIGFVDGTPVGLPNDLPRGLSIERLSRLLQTSPSAPRELFRTVTEPIHGFSAVTQASFEDAWIIRVARNSEVELPVELVVQRTQGHSWARLRLLIALEPDSALKLIERHESSRSAEFGFTGGAFDITLADGARLDHVRVCHRGSHDAEVTTTAVRVGSGARYHSWTATSGGKLTRFDTQVFLAGINAVAQLDGIYLVRGKDIVDHHILVVHECPYTKVEEHYKGIVDQEARAIFDGQIVVRPGAAAAIRRRNDELIRSNRDRMPTASDSIPPIVAHSAPTSGWISCSCTGSAPPPRRSRRMIRPRYRSTRCGPAPFRA